MKLHDLTLLNTTIQSFEQNTTGELCNTYAPLQNLTSEKDQLLGKFTSEKLNFDLQHPVDILVQPAYDGAVNLILNDDKNIPRLINSRFSVQNDTKFKIPDHYGYKDTNIYDEATFDIDTSLIVKPLLIPKLQYKGLINNAGTLACGTYTFYFKLSDADGNESEIISESSIVQIHIGEINDPQSIRMGMQEENTNKAVKFSLSNIDSGFDFVHVLFVRASSGNDGAIAKTYHRVMYDFPIFNQICDITVTGNELINTISEKELYVNFADLNTVKTQASINNILLLANTEETEHDYEELRRLSWQIIPSVHVEEKAVGALSEDYEGNDLLFDNESDKVYYNTNNIYYRVGYWPDEYYRFGIVYIFENDEISPVFNLQGCDLSKYSDITQLTKDYFGQSRREFEPNNSDVSENDANFFFEDDERRLNSKGVIKFPKQLVFDTDVQSPKIYGLKFNFEHFGQVYDANTDTYKSYQLYTNQSPFTYHKIKGFFFVRQKRIPSILAQGVVIGLTDKDRGAIPVLKTGSTYISQSFIENEDSNRMLYEFGSNVEANKSAVTNKALLVPDAELLEATYNQIFVGNNFTLDCIGKYSFMNGHSANDFQVFEFSSMLDAKKKVNSKLLNVPENTKSITNGTEYFSTLAGSPSEPYKTSDVQYIWNKTKPQYLTESKSLIRGQWGCYVGLSASNCEYGEVYNIKSEAYANESEATRLDFVKRFFSSNAYHAISERYAVNELGTMYQIPIICYRGDCFTAVFTHRMLRNFIDPELPTNTEIVNPSCWAANYGVRCTARVLESTHSNLTPDSAGWTIEQEFNDNQWLLYLLTGNILGMIINLAQPQDSDIDEIVKIDDLKSEAQKKGYLRITGITKDEYLASSSSDDSNQISIPKYETDQSIEFNKDDIIQKDLTQGLYVRIPNSDNDELYANEIVQAFEVYQGGNPKLKVGTKKKVNPQQQEADSKGLNLKAMFHSDENWDLRGLASINRADVNAVGLGQWITFPICSSHNLSFRDIDFSHATEEAAFARKRSFYPLSAMNRHNPLRDSNVINTATSITLPDKKYYLLPNVPFLKQEYFTRIYNSLMDSADSFTNEFKQIFETAYRDYPKKYGQITKIVAFYGYIYIIFSHGISRIQVPVESNYEEFLPFVCTPISEDFGSIWKDSICCTDSAIYGVDTVAKKIWKVTENGFACISDHVIGKFLIDNIDLSEFTTAPFIGHINVKTHYNKFKHDVIFTYYNDKPYHINEDGSKTLIDLLYDHSLEADKLRNSITEWEEGLHWSVCYNEDQKVFTTFYDWYPLESENIDNIYFSFGLREANTLKSSYEYIIKSPYYRINKHSIDKAFNTEINVYFDTNIELNPLFLKTKTEYVLSCYVKCTAPVNFNNIPLNIPLNQEWYLVQIPIWNGKLTDYIINSATFTSTNRFYVADVKLTNIEASVHEERESIIIGTPIIFNNFDSVEYANIRNNPNNLKLWKHGQAGNYDNAGIIKPTHWYGEQHEFNFEFVVNKQSIIQKIFNNLKIISTKAEPMKFEYEVVGEGYDWYTYKPIVLWIHKHFLDLNSGYIEVLTNTYGTLKETYPDFPEIFGISNQYIFKKLPYLQLEKDKKIATKSNLAVDPELKYEDAYKDNTSETVLVINDDLKEQRIRTVQFGNDMKKYGRIRGNMEYLEDLWDVEIRPIAFKYAYWNGTLKFTDLQETRHRDKYINIKIRYSGKDLVLIRAIESMFTYSHA